MPQRASVIGLSIFICYQTFYLSLLSDLLARRARQLIGPKDFLSLFLAFMYNVSYHVGRMTTNTKTKGDEMTTKIIGLCIAASVGTVTAINIIGLFSFVADTIKTTLGS